MTLHLILSDFLEQRSYFWLFVLYCTSLHPTDLMCQDVLIPWHRPAPASSAGESEGGAGAGGRDTTTTCTSEEDVTHYHAYTQVDTVDTLDICRYL